MALGRPVNKDTQYKVIVHTLGKHRYASTKVFAVGEDGKKRYSYKHWGTLDESNRFHPTYSGRYPVSFHWQTPFYAVMPVSNSTK